MEETAPPSLAAAMSEKKSRWPIVFGVIAIIFAAFGLLGALSSPFLAKFSLSQVEVLKQSGVTVPDEVVEGYKAVVRNNAIGSGILSLLLLIGGILLVKRRPVAAMLLQIWSVLKIVVGGYLLWSSLGPSNAYSKLSLGGLDAGSQEAEIINTSFAVMEKVQLIGGMIWLSAFPVILLIWLNRGLIKKEIATW